MKVCEDTVREKCKTEYDRQCKTNLVNKCKTEYSTECTPDVKQECRQWQVGRSLVFVHFFKFCSAKANKIQFRYSQYSISNMWCCCIFINSWYHLKFLFTRFPCVRHSYFYKRKWCLKPSICPLLFRFKALGSPFSNACILMFLVPA